jgi:hypothetical protein
MRFMKKAIAALSLTFALCPFASAVVIVHNWTGVGYYSNVEIGSNWQGDVAPNFTNGSATLVFAPSPQNYVSFAGVDKDIAGLQVSGFYRFAGNSNLLSIFGGGLTVTAPAGKSRLEFASSSLYVNVGANQTWDIGANASVVIGSAIKGSGQITKTGAGTLFLGSNNDEAGVAWSGGLVLNQGTVVLGGRRGYSDVYEGIRGIAGQGLDPVDSGESHAASGFYASVPSGALGTGTLTIGPATGNPATTPTLVASWDQNNSEYFGFGDDDTIIIPNDISVNGTLNTVNDSVLRLTGTLTLAIDSVLTSRGENLEISGPITEPGVARKLTVNTTNAVIHFGSSLWTGGTEVTQGVLIFAGTTANLPGTGSIQVGGNGYVGVSRDQVLTETDLQSFLGKITATSTGSIGFDSDPMGELTIFGGGATISLAGKDPNLRLGSATRAIIAGDATLTPAGGPTDPYRFGGGGGELTVAAALTGARGVTVESPAELPLTLRLTNDANTFTGTVNVNHSAVIFGNNGAADDNVPNGTNRFVLGGAASYVGSEDPDTMPVDFLSLFSPTTPGVLGFDKDPTALSTRVVDLTGVGLASLTQAYLGTASRVETETGPAPGVRFTGTIGSGGGNVHRFAGYKGGFLEVAGTLAGFSLVIGHPDALGTFGDRVREMYSTVLLSGNNNTGLAGGTTLYGGHLMLGHAQALGGGPLTVAPVNFTIPGDDGDISPLLSTSTSGLTIANAVVLQNDLNIGGDHAFGLSGIVSGGGELYVGEDAVDGFTFTLSGANTFTGGVYVSRNSTLVLDHNQALGAGPLAFGQAVSTNTPTVVFNTSAPVVNGLSSDEFASLLLNQDNTVLTVNQPSSLEYGDTFSGEIRSESSTGSLRLVKAGPGTLVLNGNDYRYDYGLFGYGFGDTALSGNPNVVVEVQAGRLVLDQSFYLEDYASTIWVNGGTFATVQQSISNPVVVSAGTLAGTGYYYSNVSLGSGARLAPGFDDAHGRIGTLNIDHLTAGPGSILEIDIRSTNPDDPSRNDFLQITTDSTLEITATALQPWVIRPVSLDSSGVNGILGGIEPDATYSWTIAHYQGLSGVATALNPSNIVLDLSAFQTSVAGSFSIQFSNIGEAASGTLNLNFTAVPEPSTYALLLLGLGAVGLAARRRARRDGR